VTRADADAFAELMARFDLAYPRSPISAEAKAAVYFPALADLNLEQVATGVAAWMRSPVAFPPSPGELRAAALGRAQERAALAWARVKYAALIGTGGYRPLTFDDPILHATIVAMGGWSQLYSLGFRDAEGVDWATRRREFLELYAIYASRGAPPDTPAALAPAVRTDRDDAAIVPASPAAIERPTREPIKALPERTGDFRPGTEDFADLVKEITKRTSTVEQRRQRPPAMVRRPMPPSDEEQRTHEERKAIQLQRMRDAGFLRERDGVGL
jgi:hypothetical protein